MSGYELKKSLSLSEFVVAEYPGLLLKFLPGGILNIIGETKAPVIHNYSITHIKDKCTLKISPHAIEGHEEFDVIMNKNHITLTSVLDDTQVLHLIRLKLKEDIYAK